MEHSKEEEGSGQMSSDKHDADAAKHVDEKEAAASSRSSSSSEHIDEEEDDFFQIEGPILSSQFSLGPAECPNQSPQAQAMSREEAPNVCPDPKRIPSSVFTRSKSTAPTDWSITSNESLFSISVGNTSFSKDHLCLYGKSGEMGNLNDPLAPLPPLPRQSPGSSPIKGEVSPKATEESSSMVRPTALREKGVGDTDYTNGLSHRSDGSTTSFAFPILTGDERSSGCLKDNQPELDRQSTVQLSQPAEPRDENDETPKAAMEAPQAEEAPVPASASASAPVAAEPPPPQPPATTKWFPWCSCCPFCC